jgi:hypothetical protein
LINSTATQPAAASAAAQPRVGFHPDDTTPVLRPSHYYGRRQQSSMNTLLRTEQKKADPKALPAPPLAPAADALTLSKIDKSQPTVRRHFLKRLKVLNTAPVAHTTAAIR